MAGPEEIGKSIANRLGFTAEYAIRGRLPSPRLKASRSSPTLVYSAQKLPSGDLLHIFHTMKVPCRGRTGWRPR
jgi:hypothetical protein